MGLGEEFAGDARELKDAIDTARQEGVLIAVVGAAKRGKSTLLNGLLGRKDDTLAPVGRFPATNVVSIFGVGDTLKARVWFENDDCREVSEHEVRQYACEECNPSNQKKVKYIDIEGPFPGLDRRTRLVDLPGTDNALAEQDAQTLYAWLPRADAIIFITTAHEPINAAEQSLLRHVLGLGIEGIYFAINKKDLVRLGEMDSDELADGVAHNRKIIEDVGIKVPSVFVISAKDYLEGKPDSGVEELSRAIQKLVEERRIRLICERLEARLKLVIEAVHARCTNEYALAQTTTKDLETRRTELAKFRRELERGRPNRESEFQREWSGAIEAYTLAVKNIERDLVEQYEGVISKAPSADLSSLHQTLHSDVHLELLKRIAPEADKCQTKLKEAQIRLTGISENSVLGKFQPQAPNAPRGIAGDLAGTAKVGVSALPALATGAAVLATPGWVGALIGTAVPSVAATWWNPLTWLAAAVATPGAVVVTGVQGVVVGTLSAIAAPLSLAALGYAGYRSYRTWKNIKAHDRRELAVAVRKMIEGACAEVIEHPKTGMAALQRQCAVIVAEYNNQVNQQIDAADDKIEELIANRPSERRVLELHQRTVAIDRIRPQLDSAKGGTGDPRDGRDGGVHQLEKLPPA
jgi:GTPase Era involved in 16S rRNA processing